MANLVNTPQKATKASCVLQKNNADFSLDDHAFMNMALALAKKGASLGEVPVGAVLVCNGQVLGRGFNQPIIAQDATAHAEIIAIRQACQAVQNYRLPKGCTLYVTLEPCTMCLGAIIHARVTKVIFGAYEPKAGVIISQEKLSQKTFFNHYLIVEGGLLADLCGQILSDFFAQRRQQKLASKQCHLS